MITPDEGPEVTLLNLTEAVQAGKWPTIGQKRAAA